MSDVMVREGRHFTWKAKKLFDRSCYFDFHNLRWYLVFCAEKTRTFSLWLKPGSGRNVGNFPLLVKCFAVRNQRSIGDRNTFISNGPWKPRYRIWSASRASVNFTACSEIEFVVIFPDVMPTRIFKTSVAQDTDDALEPDLESLSSDFSHLLTSGYASDVQLKCGGVTRKLHRSVLAARSEVFSAMFQNRMAESVDLDIVDLDVDVLDLFLQYVYSGKVAQIPEDTLPRMYSASDRYAVRFLKRMCCDCIMDALSEDNCGTFLVVADDHNDEEFKNVLTASIVGHPEWLYGEAWYAFSEEHPKLAIEVYRKFCKQTLLDRQRVELKSILAGEGANGPAGPPRTTRVYKLEV